jgi:hypothetical protein
MPSTRTDPLPGVDAFTYASRTPFAKVTVGGALGGVEEVGGFESPSLQPPRRIVTRSERVHATTDDHLRGAITPSRVAQLTRKKTLNLF